MSEPLYQADSKNHDEEEGDDVVHVTVVDVGDIRSSGTSYQRATTVILDISVLLNLYYLDNNVSQANHILKDCKKFLNR